ncbi:MAG: ABC transporter permease [Firmicutes bacterium]|nr:ABC transporter permease [Bacillota bacterium]
MIAKFKECPLVILAASIILLLTVIALLAPVISPYDPLLVNMKESLQGPSPKHLMGTDQLGRDLFSRILYGTRISLSIAFATVAACVVLGVAVGSVAGYLGGIVDDVLMRVVDILMAFPGLLLTIAIAGMLGPSMQNLMMAMIVTSWVGYARIARGAVLSVKEYAFVEAARSLGSSGARILVEHIIPNIVHPIIVMATLNMGYTILSIAGLSFIGLGAQPPAPEWGAMLNEACSFMGLAPHLFVFPGLAIMITVLAFNFLGDGLRDMLDPRFKKEVEI